MPLAGSMTPSPSSTTSRIVSLGWRALGAPLESTSQRRASLWRMACGRRVETLCMGPFFGGGGVGFFAIVRNVYGADGYCAS